MKFVQSLLLVSGLFMAAPAQAEPPLDIYGAFLSVPICIDKADLENLVETSQKFGAEAAAAFHSALSQEKRGDSKRCDTAAYIEGRADITEDVGLLPDGKGGYVHGWLMHINEIYKGWLLYTEPVPDKGA